MAEGVPSKRRSLATTFLVVWAGQFVSLVGTQLTAIGLGIWVFVDTGSTTRLAFILLAANVPRVLVTPFAGALVDRWDRRWAMIISDAGAAVGTAAIAVLLLTDSLDLWHLYVALGFSSVFQAFQYPAYTASTTLLVAKEQYGRAAAFVQVAESVTTLIAPVLAGVLLVAGDLEAVIIADLATFLFALVTLAVVRFPRPEASAEGARGAGTLFQEAWFGLRYLLARPGLFYLVLFVGAIALLAGFINILLFPLVLSFAGEAEFGTVVSIGALGVIAGSVIMTAWGGPQRKVLGVLLPLAAAAIGLVVMGLDASLVTVAIGLFLLLFSVPFVNASNQAIFQVKVEPDLQGRVFATRRLFVELGGPIGFLLAAPLAEQVFEPLLADGGALADSVGDLIGTGPGRGVALMYIVFGVMMAALLVAGFASPRLRNVEDELPDAVPDDVPREPVPPQPGVGGGAPIATTVPQGPAS